MCMCTNTCMYMNVCMCNVHVLYICATCMYVGVRTYIRNVHVRECMYVNVYTCERACKHVCVLFVYVCKTDTNSRRWLHGDWLQQKSVATWTVPVKLERRRVLHDLQTVPDISRGRRSADHAGQPFWITFHGPLPDQIEKVWIKGSRATRCARDQRWLFVTRQCCVGWRRKNQFYKFTDVFLKRKQKGWNSTLDFDLKSTMTQDLNCDLFEEPIKLSLGRRKTSNQEQR